MSSELENLEQKLLNSPAARARFLADTVELFEKSGVDVNSADFQQQFQPALDLTDGARFLSGLAASSVVIVAASAGQRGTGGADQEGFGTSMQRGPFRGGLGNAASSVVIVAATAGQRGSIGGGLGNAASSVVIVAATAGQRGSIGGGLGNAASSVVIVAATAGQRGSIGGRLGNAASSVVIVAASAGQRGSIGGNLGNAASSVVIVAATAGQRGGVMRGGMESAPIDDTPNQTVTISVPASITIAEIAHGLQVLAELLLHESAGLDHQIKTLSEPTEPTN